MLLKRVVGKSQRIQAELGESWLFFREALGLSHAELTSARGSVILMYHGVVTDKASRFNWRHVSSSDFEIHLKLISQFCNVLSVKNLLSGDHDPERLNVALTFDDGYENNYLNAFPLLEEYEVPASFYITGANDFGSPWLWPDFLDIVSQYAHAPVEIEGRLFIKKGKTYVDAETQKHLAQVIKTDRPDYAFKESMYTAFGRWAPNLYRPDFLPYWKLMSDEAICKVARSPWITVGCHGYYHNNLGEVPHDRALGELDRCRLYLQSLIKQPVTELAYPDGSYTEALAEEANKMGFSEQLAVDLRFGEPANNLVPARRAGIYSFQLAHQQLFSAVAESVNR